MSFFRRKPPQTAMDHLSNLYNEFSTTTFENLTLEDQHRHAEALQCWKSAHTNILYKLEHTEKLYPVYTLSPEEFEVLEEIKAIRDQNVKHLVRVQLLCEEDTRRESARDGHGGASTRSSNAHMPNPTLRGVSTPVRATGAQPTKKLMMKTLRGSKVHLNDSAHSLNSATSLKAANLIWSKPQASTPSENNPRSETYDPAFDSFSSSPNLEPVALPTKPVRRVQSPVHNVTAQMDSLDPYIRVSSGPKAVSPKPVAKAPQATSQTSFQARGASTKPQTRTQTRPQAPPTPQAPTRAPPQIFRAASPATRASPPPAQKPAQTNGRPAIQPASSARTVAQVKPAANGRPVAQATTSTRTIPKTTQTRPAAKSATAKPISRPTNGAKPATGKTSSPAPRAAAVSAPKPASKPPAPPIPPKRVSAVSAKKEEQSPADPTPLDYSNLNEEQTDTFIESLRGVDPTAAKQILNEIIVRGDEVYWDDIAGLEAAKNSLKETVVYPFLRPDLFSGLREPARGMLLFGPPGTGKTMLARAVATESHSTFFSISASSLTSKYLGESEKLVRALFQIAKKLAPAIIFVDEIDSILSSRSDNENESSRRIKNEFLIQWSDLSSATANHDEDVSRVLVLAATNLPWAIDEAARRRFVRRQYIPLPEAETRKVQLLRLLARQNHSLGASELDELIAMTDGFSGSDMTALARDGAMGPLRALGDKLLSTPRDSIRPMSLEDFRLSLRFIRPSVGKEGLKEYEEWAEKFGSSGV